MNWWFGKHALRNHRLLTAITHVATRTDGSSGVLGFYALAPASIDFTDVPEEIREEFGAYPVPVFRLARMAVSRELEGQGVGTDLLFAAAARARRAATDVGGVGLLIDAKDATLAEWYTARGCEPLLDDPLRLILTWQNVDATIEAASHE